MPALLVECSSLQNAFYIKCPFLFRAHIKFNHQNCIPLCLIHKVILADKTESIPSLNTELEVQTELQYFEGHGTLSMKHDGFNVQVNYYKGKLVNIMTRGRSCDAMDVSKLRSRVPAEIPVQDKIKIVCECTVSKANFPFCASMFGNVSERSAVSSVLAKPEYIHLLDVHAFDVHGYEVKPENKFELLQSWGFQTPKFYKVNNYNEIMILVKQKTVMSLLQMVLYLMVVNAVLYVLWHGKNPYTRVLLLVIWNSSISIVSHQVF